VANNALSKLKRLQEQALAFFHETGIGREDDAKRSRLHRFAHFWLLVGKSFNRNRCPLRASALAYTTLLALVPLLAVGASILTGFLQTKGKKPIDEMVKSLVENVAPMLNLQVKTEDPAATSKLDEAVNKITEFIGKIKAETIGLTGILALLFVAIALLRTIEATFNDIWGVTRGRGWVESIIHYFATIAGGPLILALVLGLSTGPQFDTTKRFLGLTSFAEKRVGQFAELAQKLGEGSDLVSVYLRSRFDDESKKTLYDYTMRKGDGKKALATLVQNLNKIAAGESVYDERRFDGVSLRPETKALLGRKLAGQELARLNRLLIEDAYPRELTPKRESFLGGFFFELLPFVVLSLAFALFYKLMPNTSVQAKAALVGGIVGGTLWQLNNKLSVFYVSKVISYSQIYGSLSVFPLFLIGMYFSWLILLFGAQVAYAFQNRQSYLQEKQAEGVNQRGREFIALRVMTNLAQHFQRGAKSPGVNQLAAALGVPSRLVGRLMSPLLEAKLIVEVIDEETGYAPARPLKQITAHDILTALRVGQGTELETLDDGTRGYVRGKFESIYGAERDVAADMTLEALANGAPAVPVSANPSSA
jgi:YihY family inner membrane protein